MDGTQGITRRGVLKTLLAGSGVVMFGIGLPTRNAAAGSASEVTSWVLIHPDNRVVIRIPQTELGQGVTTAGVKRKDAAGQEPVKSEG